MNPIDPLGLFSESWPTSIVPLTVELSQLVNSFGNIPYADVFFFIPSDTELDRMFVYLSGTKGFAGTATLSVQLIQSTKGGGAKELTNAIALSGQELDDDETVEFQAIDTMEVSRPVFLRLLGTTINGAATNWMNSANLFCSAHFLATFNIEVQQQPATTDARMVNGRRLY